ncbi:MAG: hypothetical protein V4547_17995 [Bacteroidota bacterium]
MEETATEKKITAYGKKLEAQLKIQKDMLDALTGKAECLDIIIKARAESKMPFKELTNSLQLEFFDNRILLIKTNGEIDVLKRVIAEKESYYKNYMTQFEKNIIEVDNNFDKIFKLAKESKNPPVQKLMSTIHWTKVDTDDDAKIEAFRLLKKYF